MQFWIIVEDVGGEEAHRVEEGVPVRYWKSGEAVFRNHQDWMAAGGRNLKLKLSWMSEDSVMNDTDLILESRKKFEKLSNPEQKCLMMQSTATAKSQKKTEDSKKRKAAEKAKALAALGDYGDEDEEEGMGEEFYGDY